MSDPPMIALSSGKHALVGAVLGVALTLFAPLPTRAQALSATDYSTYYQWDELRRLEMKIGPDPDGAGGQPRSAEKYTYDPDGRVVRLDTGTTTLSTGADFAIVQSVLTRYDAVGNKTQVHTNPGTAAATLTQLSYDADNRSTCTATRMSLAEFDALYGASDRPDACVIGTIGPAGADRVTQTNYDAAGQVISILRGVGTSEVQAYARYAYSLNGKQLWVKDAAGFDPATFDLFGNRTSYTYDGFDRLVRQTFPAPQQAEASPSNAADYEAYDYDANGNRAWLRKRDTRIFTYEYDALNRQTVKHYPVDATKDVYTQYDLAGLVLAARFQGASGPGVVMTYDSVGRRRSETVDGLTVGSDYDAAGNRIRVSWPGGAYVEYDYNAANQVSAVREPAGGLTDDKLVSVTYDALGRRAGTRIVNGAVWSTFGYDLAGRLNLLRYDGLFGGDAIWEEMTHNPANQVETVKQYNMALVWNGHPTATSSYAANGLNQDVAIAALSQPNGYDANGNLTRDGARQFSYDAENRLTTVSGASNLAITYDPLGRIQTTAAGATTRFLYDGDALVGEYSDSGVALRRYVHGPGVDEPLVWYEGAGTSDRHWLMADRQGSIVADAPITGATTFHTYGPYGEAQDWSGSRFRYTGQIALQEAELYHYKARVYDPKRGWFLQTDPIGYDSDDLNLYAYVGNDPLNNEDPTGNCPLCIAVGAGGGAVAGFGGQVFADVVTGHISSPQAYLGSTIGGAAGGATFGATGNVVLAGAVGGAVGSGVTAGVDAALKPGATLSSVASATGKAAVVGGVVGAATGVGGKYLAAGGKGVVAKLAQSTAAGRAVANNEKMAVMVGAKVAAGAQTSAVTGYKLVAASATSGAGASAAASTTCKVAGKC